MSDAIGATIGPGPILPQLVRYPERPETRHPWLDEIAAAAEAAVLARATRWRAKRLGSIVAAVNGHEAAMTALDDGALVREARTVAGLLKRNRDWSEAVVAHSFAVIREAAKRQLGQRHYDVQLIGAYAMVRGMIAEMATGEGKTLAATLVAATAALAGVPVHVVTVNSYLAVRDAETMSSALSVSRP